VILDEMCRLAEKVRKRNISDRPEDEIGHDIYAYCENSLRSIKTDYAAGQTSRRLTIDTSLVDWPTPDDVNKLVQKSGTIFQYAKVACRIIGERGESPVIRPEKVLEGALAGDLDKM